MGEKIDVEEDIQVSIDNYGNLLPSNESSRRCTYLFYNKNDKEGYDWESVSGVTKDFYWIEFKQHIYHPGFTEGDILKAWESKASRRYSDWMSYLRTKRKTCPEDIPIANWNAWAKYWKTDKFLKKARKPITLGLEMVKGWSTIPVGHKNLRCIVSAWKKLLEKKSMQLSFIRSFTPIQRNLGSFVITRPRKHMYFMRRF